MQRFDAVVIGGLAWTPSVVVRGGTIGPRKGPFRARIGIANPDGLDAAGKGRSYNGANAGIQARAISSAGQQCYSFQLRGGCKLSWSRLGTADAGRE